MPRPAATKRLGSRRGRGSPAPPDPRRAVCAGHPEYPQVGQVRHRHLEGDRRRFTGVPPAEPGGSPAHPPPGWWSLGGLGPTSQLGPGLPPCAPPEGETRPAARKSSARVPMGQSSPRPVIETDRLSSYCRPQEQTSSAVGGRPVRGTGYRDVHQRAAPGIAPGAVLWWWNFCRFIWGGEEARDGRCEWRRSPRGQRAVSADFSLGPDGDSEGIRSTRETAESSWL